MHFDINDGIAVFSMDDGKANVVGHSLLDDLDNAMTSAEEARAGALVLRGREGVFSGGFDLKEFQKGPEASVALVSRGLLAAIRLYSLGLPVVAACTGHAVAMGAFLLLASDTRIGVHGDFKITLPETAIGMDIPRTLVALTQSRLSPRFLTRGAIQAEVFTPDLAVEAGFLDAVVDAADLEKETLAIAQRLAALPAQNYATNKHFARHATLTMMQEEYDKQLASI